MILAALLALQVGAATAAPPPPEQEDALTQVMRMTPWSLVYINDVGACLFSFRETSSAEEYSAAVSRNILEINSRNAELEAKIKDGPLKGDGVHILSSEPGECLVRHSGPSIDDFRHGAMVLFPYFMTRDPRSSCKITSLTDDKVSLTCTGPESLNHAEEFSQTRNRDGSGEFLYRFRYISGSSRSGLSQDLLK